MRPSEKFDIVVVGNGLTAWSCLYHLRSLGVRQLAVAAAELRPSSLQAPGLITGGVWDNYTRISQAHGTESARILWNFGNQAWRSCHLLAVAAHAATPAAPRLRLITSASELEEALLATQQLQAAGYKAKIYRREDALPWWQGLGERVIALQHDGEQAAWIDTQRVMERLRLDSGTIPRIGKIVGYERDKRRGGLVLYPESGRPVHCELAVFAAHTGIRQLLGDLADVLVTAADQWANVDWHEAPHAWQQPGLVWSAHHGHEWGVISPHGHRVGGLRYLRPLGGFEANEAVLLDQVSKQQQALLQQTWPGLKRSNLEQPQGVLDIRPCDELPLIGPMFGDDRILVATGFMGYGLSWAFKAGQCVAELAVRGQAPDLPRILWPERLRTLSA